MPAYRHPFGVAIPSLHGKPELEIEQTWAVFKDERRRKNEFCMRVVVFEKGWDPSLSRPRLRSTIEEVSFVPYGKKQWIEEYHSVFPDLILPDTEGIFPEIMVYFRGADNLMIAEAEKPKLVKQLRQVGGSIPKNLGRAQIVTVPRL